MVGNALKQRNQSLDWPEQRTKAHTHYFCACIQLCFYRTGNGRVNKLTCLNPLLFLSILLQLVVFIGVRAVECVTFDGISTNAINVWPEDGWNGALQAIPIYICAFACHFNVLPVHGELAKPTRERLHRMVSWVGDFFNKLTDTTSFRFIEIAVTVVGVSMVTLLDYHRAVALCAESSSV